MLNVSLYNQEGKVTQDIALNEQVFGQAANVSLVHQVFTALRANQRQSWAHTKDRSEVRGGGKKPWKQKGTGRARHGSIRSPIWSGGGITFGPRSERNYKQKINKKMNQQAVRVCLSDKVTHERFVVVEQFPGDEKTKTLATLRAALPGNGKTTLLVVTEAEQGLLKVSRNIPRVGQQRAEDLNVLDLMNHQYVVASKAALQVLEQRLA